jgi:hypothetical protein
MGGANAAAAADVFDGGFVARPQQKLASMWANRGMISI